MRTKKTASERDKRRMEIAMDEMLWQYFTARGFSPARRIHHFNGSHIIKFPGGKGPSKLRKLVLSDAALQQIGIAFATESARG